MFIVKSWFFPPCPPYSHYLDIVTGTKVVGMNWFSHYTGLYLAVNSIFARQTLLVQSTFSESVLLEVSLLFFTTYILCICH